MSHHIARNISDGLKLGLTAGTALEGDNAEITKLGYIVITGGINLDDEKQQTDTNATDINGLTAQSNGIKNNTLASTLKTAVDANSAKTGISVSQSNQITANTAKNSYPSADATKVGYLTITGGADIDAMKALGNTNSSAISTLTTDTTNKFAMTSSTSMKTAIDLNTAKTGLSASNEAKLDNLTISSATDLDAIRTELNNIVLTTTQISNDRIILGSAPSFGTGCGIQNPAFDATMVNTKVMIRQDNNGGTYLNCATGRSISFRRNNVELFNDGEVQALTDNISVSQSVDLDTMETNIATNNAKNSYPSGDATKMGHISVSQAVDLDDMESKIALNTSLIYVNVNSINNIALPPLKIHALAHMVSHIGTTAKG